MLKIMPALKTSAMAALLAVSVATGSTACSNNTRNNNTAQTEENVSIHEIHEVTACSNNTKDNNAAQTEENVSSQGVTDAMRAQALYNGPSMHNARNKVLDEKVIATAENETEKQENIEAVNSFYKQFGIFGSADKMQRYLNQVYIIKTLEDYRLTSGLAIAHDPTLPASDDPLAEMFGAATAEDLVEELNENVKIYKDFIENDFFRYDIVSGSVLKNPTAEACSQHIDNYIKTIEGLSKDDLKEYSQKTADFKKKQGDVSKWDATAYSNYIAYQTFMIDYLCLKKSFMNSDYFKEDKFFWKKFEEDFVPKVAPQPVLPQK